MRESIIRVRVQRAVWLLQATDAVRVPVRERHLLGGPGIGVARGGGQRR